MLWPSPVYQITIPMIRYTILNLCVFFGFLWVFLDYRVEGFDFDTVIREMTNIASNPVAEAGGSKNVASGGAATAVGGCANRVDEVPPDSLGYDPCIPQERDTTTSEEGKDMHTEEVGVLFEDFFSEWDKGIYIDKMSGYGSRSSNIIDLMFSCIVKSIRVLVAELYAWLVAALYVWLFVVAVALGLTLLLPRHFFPSTSISPFASVSPPTSVSPPAPVPRKVLDTPPEAMSSERMTCSVCMVNGKNIVFDLCGHVASCETCSLQLQPQKCPMCQKPFTKMQRIYF